MSRLDEIRARCEAATKGPWRCEIETHGCHWLFDGLGTVLCYLKWEDADDAEFIAHARADLPALLAVATAAAEYMKVSGPGGQDMARTLGERHWRRELRAALDALGGER